MTHPLPRLFASLIAAAALLAGCAAGAGLTRTLDDTRGESYQNILVIGIAAGYEGRAMFERSVVSKIRAAGGSAEAYYRIIGNNPPIDREQVREVVSQGNFDAVLVTRVDDRAYSVREQQGAIDAQATTKGGNVFNFFRYDYVELNEPASLDLTGSVVLTTELYAAADKRKAWAVKTTARDMANMSDLVEASASAVVKRMQRDGLIAR